MKEPEKINTHLVLFFRVGLMFQKSKTVRVEDEEIENGFYETVIQVPLKNPLIAIEIEVSTLTEVVLSGTYIDEFGNIYYATDKNRLHGRFSIPHDCVYEKPKCFVLVSQSFSESSSRPE